MIRLFIKKSGKLFSVAIVLISCLLLLSFSCGGNKSQNKESADIGKVNKIAQNTVNPSGTAQNEVPNEVPNEVMDRGEKVYSNYCLACHQVNGSGNPGMYPPLDGTKKVLGEKKDLILILLNGLTGQIEVKGEVYYQAMAPHNFLTDQEMADVLTYIRNSFGNSASMVMPEEVKKVRSETKPQS